MRVLVTGGAGYIGSNTAQRLLEAGHQVRVLDSLEKGHRAAVPEGAEFVQGDFGDPQILRPCLAGIEAVLHFAAYIEAGESMQEPARYFHNNSSKALTLLQTMQEEQVSQLVFSSTAALYGQPRSLPIPEDAPLDPTNAYGESKLLVERMLRWFHDLHGLRYASLRYFNAAGATAQRGEAHHPETHLIPIVLQVAAGERHELAIYGDDYETEDGTCVRDYIHIEDLASAHLLALEAAPRFSRQIYNLGNGSGFSVRQVVEVARQVTGRNIPTRIQPRRPGDPAQLVACSRRIREQLGWKPAYPELATILESAWKWKLKNPHGYPPDSAT